MYGADCQGARMMFVEEEVAQAALVMSRSPRSGRDSHRDGGRRVADTSLAGSKAIRYGTAYVALAASEKWWVM
jgi:hypothetical protein